MEIITRTEAIEKGQKWYFTGVPCKRGHIAKRNIKNRHCHRCLSIYSTELDRQKRANELNSKNHTE